MSPNQDIKGIGADTWNAFVESHPLGTIYHHTAWHSVIEDTYGLRASYHISYGTDKKIIAAVPAISIKGLFGGKRVVSYPFSDCCDPLIGSSGEFKDLMDSIKKTEKAKEIEIRGYRIAEMPGYGVHKDYCNYVLPLDRDFDAIFKTFHKDCVQRAVKKAQKNKIEVVEGSDIGAMKEFYNLHILTRKKHGVPVQPFRFFRNLWNTLYPKGMLSVLLSKKDGVCLAGVVILKYKGVAYYKFGASDPASVNLGTNQVLMNEAIKKAKLEGFGSFDFGRTYIGNEGLMEYKSRWGAKQEMLSYIYSPEKKSQMNNEGSALNSFVSGVFKRMPAFSIRLFGELFYKYFA